MLCGTVPASLQAVGNKVLFSGMYKPDDKSVPRGHVGLTVYYLEVAKAAEPTKNE
jgi:hypothetical protein